MQSLLQGFFSFIKYTNNFVPNLGMSSFRKQLIYLWSYYVYIWAIWMYPLSKKSWISEVLIISFIAIELKNPSYFHFISVNFSLWNKKVNQNSKTSSTPKICELVTNNFELHCDINYSKCMYIFVLQNLYLILWTSTNNSGYKIIVFNSNELNNSQCP